MPGLSDLTGLFGPVAAHRSLGLAVSGGADSLALLLLASAWARATPDAPKLTVYSVDHGLRPEAAGEVAFVAGEAARLGLACRVLRWSEPKPLTGVQAAARNARYRLIGAAMRADGVELLLTGHHRDDQAETVLMRLAHGSGLAGLRGMDRFAEVEGLGIFRPFLDIPHAALAEVVTVAGLVAVADSSNDDRHYERVRWRQAMPELVALGIDSERVAALARRAGDADAAISAWAGAAFAENVVIDGFGAAMLSAEALSRLPRAVGIKLVGTMLARIGGEQRPRALAIVERLHEKLTAGVEVRRLTTLGVVLGRTRDKLWFAREPGRVAPAPMRLAPRQSLLWDRRFRIDNRGDTPIEIGMARHLSRREAEALVGRRVVAPAPAIRSAPLVQGSEGRPLALGTHRFDDRIAIVFSSEYLAGQPGVTAN